MKILFLLYNLETGGAERQVLTLAQGLRAAGDQVAVLCFYKQGTMVQEYEKAGIPLHSLNKRGRWDIRFAFDLIGYVRREKPDIVHSYLNTANVAAGLLKCLLWRLNVVFGLRSTLTNVQRDDSLDNIISRLQGWLSHVVSLLICNSEAGFKFYTTHGFSRKRCLVIHNGIDTERFHPDPAARQRTRSEWGITDSECLIGIVARQHKIKDYPTFIRAAAQLARGRSDVRFVGVGGGGTPEYRQELERLVSDLGLGERLIWGGPRADVECVYPALDVATLTSVSESFPNVVCEAMASGVPCVVTDVGDAALIVEGTGIVVPPGNPEALADGWQRMLDRLAVERAALQEKVRARIVERFSVAHLVQQTRQAFEQVIHR